MRKNLSIKSIRHLGVIFILLLTFLSFGEFAVFFFGVLLFYITGYIFISKKTFKSETAFFLVTSIIFCIILYFYMSSSMYQTGEIETPKLSGFLLYISTFSVAYLLGSIIKLLIKNENIRSLVFFALLGLIVFRCSVYLGKPFAASFSGLFYFLTCLYLLRKNQLNLIILLLGLTVPFFSIYVIQSGIIEEAAIIFLYIFLAVLVAILLNKRLNNIKRLTSKIIFIISLLLVSILNYGFMLNWTEYVYNSRIELPQDLFKESFINTQCEPISSEEFKGKIVVLDLWTIYCGVCFKKFPEFERFYLENRDRKDLLIYSVNVPIRDEICEDIQDILKIHDYEFPTIISENDFKHYRKVYKIDGVPSVLIINKNGEVVYNKRFNNNPLVFVNNLQRNIDNLLD